MTTSVLLSPGEGCKTCAFSPCYHNTTQSSLFNANLRWEIWKYTLCFHLHFFMKSYLAPPSSSLANASQVFYSLSLSLFFLSVPLLLCPSLPPSFTPPSFFSLSLSLALSLSLSTVLSVSLSLFFLYLSLSYSYLFFIFYFKSYVFHVSFMIIQYFHNIKGV